MMHCVSNGRQDLVAAPAVGDVYFDFPLHHATAVVIATMSGAIRVIFTWRCVCLRTAQFSAACIAGCTMPSQHGSTEGMLTRRMPFNKSETNKTSQSLKQ
jgi:hypothetical protein